MRRCFHSGIAPIVRMLCRRSASLMTSTRQSLAIATSILRIVAACCASLESKRSRSSLVTPSTSSPTSGPNCSSIRSSVDRGVLDRVMEEGGRHAHRVEAEAGDDRGDGDRVGDVVLPRHPQLALVRLRGQLVGSAHDPHVLARAVAPQHRHDALDAGRGRGRQGRDQHLDGVHRPRAMVDVDLRRRPGRGRGHLERVDCSHAPGYRARVGGGATGLRQEQTLPSRRRPRHPPAVGCPTAGASAHRGPAGRSGSPRATPPAP